MTENQSKFTKKVVWTTVFIFCIRCFISGTKIITDFSIYDLYGYTGCKWRPATASVAEQNGRDAELSGHLSL